jgi:hypothetical protein
VCYRALPCFIQTYLFYFFTLYFFLHYRYSADEVYDVVSDVAKYQDFLPWCTHSRVLFKTPTRMDAELGTTQQQNNATVISALTLSCIPAVLCDAGIGFKMLPGQSYVSQITMERPRSLKVMRSWSLAITLRPLALINAHV